MRLFLPGIFLLAVMAAATAPVMAQTPPDPADSSAPPPVTLPVEETPVPADSKPIYTPDPVTPAIDPSAYSSDAPPAPPAYLKYIPEVSLHLGRMYFSGDVGYRGLQAPLKYKIGYSVSLQKNLFAGIGLTAFYHKGNLYGNEKLINQSPNFYAPLSAFGAGITYSFKDIIENYLKAPAIISPYIRIGFASLNYKTYSDLKDASGNAYYYWSDGSIRNLPESGINYLSSNILRRDYDYETQVNPATTVMAFPLGGGIRYHITNRFTVDFDATVYMSVDDKIDNVQKSGKDKFYFFNVALNYNISVPKYIDPASIPYLRVDFKAFAKEDNDSDGVKDMSDRCPGTPAGVAVDINGCPLDDDGDGIANYLDKEPNSRPGAVVDEHGIEMTEEYLARKEAEKAMQDSIDFYTIPRVQAERKVFVSTISDSSQMYYTPEFVYEYRVALGNFKDSIPPDLIEKFLAVEDLNTQKQGDGTTTYSTGIYHSRDEAEKRREELIGQGIKEAVVVENVKVRPKGGSTVSDIAGTSAPHTDPVAGSSSPGQADGQLTFRVQLGAFANEVPKDLFSGVVALSVEPTTDGKLTRYVAGLFKTYDEAAAYRDEMKQKSSGAFSGAFVVAYRGDKRVSLNSVVTSLPSRVKTTSMASALKRATDENVVFRVQVGYFKDDVPSDHMGIFLTLRGVERETAEDGYTRYMVGSFKTYGEAEQYKNEVIAKGISDAFIISYIGNKQVPVAEAIEHLKKQ